MTPMGPLRALKLKKHCEMCGAQDSPTMSYRLEVAFDPKGQPKTLCQACRIGSAELLADQRMHLHLYVDKLNTRRCVQCDGVVRP